MDEPNKKLYTKQEEGMKFLTTYMESIVNTNYINILSLLHEIDLLKDWAPMVEESRIIGKASNNRELGIMKYKTVWPV